MSLTDLRRPTFLEFVVRLPSLPIVDMAAYRSGGSQARSQIIAEIAGRSRELGFFYLTNHGLSEGLLERQLTWARRFFSLPVETKMALDFRNLAVRRGYEPLALQTLQAGAQPDRKEAFSFGSEALSGAPSQFEGPNQWPPNAAGFDGAAFRIQMEAYQAAMITLGREICGLIAASLGLREDYFAEALAKPSTDVRVLHYPPRAPGRDNDETTGLFGAGAHTDWGLITLLLQDGCGGLEIETPAGWLKADPVAGALIVNLGDLAVRLTAGRYASNVHRVLNTAPGRDRYSVATFFNPHGDYVFDCVPTCRSASPAESISFADHINDMLRRTYAA
jgi:isopenicillin N synthase-like dioxygenase